MSCKIQIRLSPEFDLYLKRWDSYGSSEKERPWVCGAMFNDGLAHIQGAYSEKREAYRVLWPYIEKRVPKEVGFKQVRVMGYVEAAFRETRNRNISWSHHRELWYYGVPTCEHRKWLSTAEKKEWSVRALRVALASEKPNTSEPDDGPEFSYAHWVDGGFNWLRKLFPIGEPINKDLVRGLLVEGDKLFEEMERIGLIRPV